MTKNKVPTFSVEIDGKTYEGEVATVTQFSLGREDHGIFTADVRFKGADWDQGISGVALGFQPGEYEAAAFTAEYITSLVDTLGSPEAAVGKRVIVFRGTDRTATGWYNQIDGFAILNSDGSYGEPFFYSKIKAKYFPS